MQRERFENVVPYLAYPYGWYDATSMEAARRAEMEAAFTTQGYAVGPWYSLFAAPRIAVGEPHTVRNLRLRLSRTTIPVVAWRDGWHPRVSSAAKGRGGGVDVFHD